MPHRLASVEIDPEGEVRASVVWLHGLGADGNDFAGIAPELALPAELGVRFVFPHARAIAVTLNRGMVMPAWYDIREVGGVRYHDERGVRLSAKRVNLLLDLERQRGVPWHRIVLAGFSQGGAVALFTALRHRERLAGVVAMSTYLVLPETLPREASAVNRDLPILQTHGTLDEVVPFERGEATCKTLRALGYDVAFAPYPVGHGVCEPEIRDIGAFLRRILA